MKTAKKGDSRKEKEDPAALASRFLELWQEQWAQTLADPESAAIMSRLFATNQGGNFASFFPSGAAPGFPSPFAGTRERDELARRVDELEARLAEIERGNERDSKPAKPARRRAR